MKACLEKDRTSAFLMGLVLALGSEMECTFCVAMALVLSLVVEESCFLYSEGVCISI